MELIVATHNQGKIREIREIFRYEEIKLLSLSDLNYHQEIEETGQSFFENAKIKAETLHNIYTDKYILADDSGLEVDALDGAPGIYSARYAGENATQEQLINKLLKEMRTVPPDRRTARFICIMVLISPDNTIYSARGVCEGKIAAGPRGIHGFGYDPIFLTKDFDYQFTMSELFPDMKNRISHRSRALADIRKVLQKILRNENAV